MGCDYIPIHPGALIRGFFSTQYQLFFKNLGLKWAKEVYFQNPNESPVCLNPSSKNTLSSNHKIFFLNYTYIYSPEGRKFRSRNELRQYLEKHNLEYNAEDFDFSIWGRGNRPASKTNTNINNNAPSPVGAAATSAASPNSCATSEGTS